MLCTEHGTDFVIDIRNRHRRAQKILQNDEAANSYVLLETQESLSRLNGRTLESQGLPSPPRNLAPLDDQSDEQKHVFEELSLETIDAITKLSEQQKLVYNTVVKADFPGVTCTNLQKNGTISPEKLSPRQFQSQKKKFFFVCSRGIGKTFVINEIHKILESKGKKVIPVATSAVTA